MRSRVVSRIVFLASAACAAAPTLPAGTELNPGLQLLPTTRRASQTATVTLEHPRSGAQLEVPDFGCADAVSEWDDRIVTVSVQRAGTKAKVCLWTTDGILLGRVEVPGWSRAQHTAHTLRREPSGLAILDRTRCAVALVDFRTGRTRATGWGPEQCPAGPKLVQQLRACGFDDFGR